MTTERKQQASATFLFIFIVSILFIGIVLDRTETQLLLISYSASFISYMFIARSAAFPMWVFILIGIMVRIGLFGRLPSLSDDFYRFIWDGRLLVNGVNPYDIQPEKVLELKLKGMGFEFYKNLNSPEYFTVYPPLNQFLFWISALLGMEGRVLASVNFLRIIILLSELGSIRLMYKIFNCNDQASRAITLYFLNPLVILEFCGNIHFEGIVLFFLLLAVYLFMKDSKWQGIALGLAAAVKLVPLLFLPPFILLQWFRKGAWVSFCTLSTVTATFVPFLITKGVGAAGMLSSLKLYYQSFEFNSSIYFLLKEIGIWAFGWNMISIIGPCLAFVVLLLIPSLAIYGRKNNMSLTTLLLFSLSIFLFMSTTVHPWYILILIPLGLISGFYYPIIWSFFIFF